MRLFNIIQNYKPKNQQEEYDKEYFEVDRIISECKEVDIEVLTPNELLKLEGYEKI